MSYDTKSVTGGTTANVYQTGTNTLIACDQSPSMIRDAIGATEQSVSLLHEAITELEGRLDTVLSPQPPQLTTGGANAKDPRPSSSQVHTRMQELNAGFSHAIDRLRELARRVEI